MNRRKIFCNLFRVVICVVFAMALYSGDVLHAASLTYSKLYKVSDGYELVSYSSSTGVTIQSFDNEYKYLDTKTIDTSYILPTGCGVTDLKFGGSYEGTNNNYIVTGRDNYDEDDSVITFRLTKFTKDWEYVGCCEICNNDDVEIYQIFRASGFSMVECDEKLWISFGRTGYDGGDGYHHQGKMNILIDEATMTLLGSASDFWHSFDQYQTVCNGKVYQMELSEGSRTVYMEDLDAENYTGGWNYNWVSGSNNNISVFDFWSKDNGIWSYSLYGSTYDFEDSDSNSKLLGVIVSKDQMDLQNNEGVSSTCYNVYIAIAGTDLTDSNLVKLTSYSDKNVNSAYISKIDDDKFLVTWSVWNSDYTLETVYYQYIDSNGNTLSAVNTLEDIEGIDKPVVDSSGNVIWCIQASGSIYFYGIDAEGTAHKYSEVSIGEWKQDSKGWWYENSDGTYPYSCWKQIDEKWYAFDDNGYMRTGWFKDGVWYYLGNNGEMQTGWKLINGKWYYFESSGAMTIGWQKVNGKWYYMESSGAMTTGWQRVGGTWYYLESSGAMATGWRYVGGKWYYMESSGAMATGWKKLGNKWYYLESSGAMVTGSKQINGTWYYFNGSGEWQQ